MLIGWLVVLFLVLLALNIPVCFVLLMISTVYIVVKGVPLAALGHVLTTATDSFILTAIPLFILMGNIMNTAGVCMFGSFSMPPGSTSSRQRRP